MLRNLRREDAEDVAALFAECYAPSRALDAEEVRSWLANSELEPDWLRVLERDGRIVGCGSIWPHDGLLEADLAAPGHWHELLDWVADEARARELGRVRVQAPDGHPLAELLAARGYSAWRRSLTMEIELAGGEQAALPAGIELRSYRDGDEAELLVAMNDAFADDRLWRVVTPARFRAFFVGARGFDPSLWLLAFDAGALAGFALAYPVHGSDDRLGWIELLGVVRPWRRRGLGESLLRAAFAELHRRGLRRAGLGVDANPGGARKLYERVGMRGVRRSAHWELVLW